MEVAFWKSRQPVLSGHTACHRKCVPGLLTGSLQATFSATAIAAGLIRPRRPTRLLRAEGNADSKKSVGKVDITEVTVETDQPTAVVDLLLGFGADSASAVAGASTSTVTAHFEGAELAEADLAQMASVLQAALDLPSQPLLTQRSLGEAWIKYFPLCDSLEVRLPCHGGPAGGMLSETGRRVLRLEGGLAFGAGGQT